jgi:hypothetical protein
MNYGDAGEIIYGIYVSKESVISCYVRNLKDKRIHFISGAEGGYTKAAGMIRRKNILQWRSCLTNNQCPESLI